ncbi:MAG: hypothetical protein NTW86_31210 [Candidatus Sumerlaeota bacterium]|nr:hypothetical protein [Candidatus Sumerlaeota bacterium]
MLIRLHVLLASLALMAQATAAPIQVDDPRFNEIRAKHERGEKVTEEERDYFESIIDLRTQQTAVKTFADWAKEHPAHDSLGLIPLTDLGAGEYQGEQGGLYPGGSNTVPEAHLKAGLKLASEIAPLDREGKKSGDGRIVFCSIGMSNVTQEFRSFLNKLVPAEKSLNPKLTVVDCAQGSMPASKTKDPNFPYWKTVSARLADAGVTEQQVQAIWLKQANPRPTEPFAEHTQIFYSDMTDVLHNLHNKFPNLKIAYLSSRIYAGYAVSPLNPEPFAYEEGFTMKRLIADQIAGKPELNYDPAKGPAVAPWIVWGPYLWADGMKARKDGLVWKREDLSPDGTHPSVVGREKVAKILMDFLKAEPTAKPWFLAR